MTGLLKRRLAIVAWSIVVWCALWSDLSVANVVWGACIGLLATVLIPLHQRQSSVRVRPVGVVVYFFYAMWALVKSSGVVAWEVVTPRNRINQGIVAVPLRIESVAVATLVANTVSLTPGTLTLEIHRDPMTLYVHIMHLRSIEDVRADIGILEDLAIRAFPAIMRDESGVATGTVTEETP